MMVKIAVIGAGINGIASAVKIKEKYPQFEVALLSADFSPNTTGDGSGGLWYPYLCGDTSPYLLSKWGGETYRFLHDKWQDGCLYVRRMPMYYLYRNPHKPTLEPEWAQAVVAYRDLSETDLENLSQEYSVPYVSGHTFTTFVVHAESMLSYLYRRFEAAGGRLVRVRVQSCRDSALAPYDVVVNCTGLGARELVEDWTVFPIRGQVIRVKAPWLNHTIIDADSGHYIIPNSESCVLGGTHQENDFNTALDYKDTRFILDGCFTLIPALKSAPVLRQWVGLRPGRHQVRLEPEHRGGKLFIHNYGHGGSGLTLFWGCATDVLEIMEEKLNLTPSTTKSKL